VFVLDPAVFEGRWSSPDRTQALLNAIGELRQAVNERGGCLVVRRGAPAEVLVALAEETGAGSVHATTDAAPFALARDARVAEALADRGIAFERHPGTYCADISKIATKDGRPYVVFSPFNRNWSEAPRREVLDAPAQISSPTIEEGSIPTAGELGLECVLEAPLPAGEAAARARMDEWLDAGVFSYHERHDDMAAGSSMLSPHLHLGTLSARELEQRVL
jgi:deoxyribodipyrimidine photo-lyase